jgi:arginyl-tRNA synthetase
METFEALLTRKLAEALQTAGLPQISSAFTPATDVRFGDYQTNAALMLAKQLGQSPRSIAQTIVSHLVVGEWCEDPKIEGAGFINLRLRLESIATRTAELLGDDRLGVEKVARPRRVVVDFGSPNVAKPMHVGHIRSMVLGDALARIASFLGHDVIRDNHVGDWGTQFGMVIYGWKNLLDRASLEQDAIKELVRIYKETNELATADPNVREACRVELVRLQSGDAENVSIWKQCVDLSKKEFDRTYEILNIHYDIERGESFYNDRLSGVVERLLKSSIAELSQDAVVVFFRDISELADKPCIIRKRDGGYNYATTDLATVDYRINDLKADTVWYVVGAPQILHFKQVFEIARREGYTADFRHITFGSILGEDRKLMKTRSGDNVSLGELLDEAITRAGEIVQEKNPSLSQAEGSEIARKIGIGAVKYADLAQYRMTDYIFSWDKMLSFQGNTAPYLQNAYVRIRSIFRKAVATSQKASTGGVEIMLEASEERNLAAKLCQFAEVVPSILNDFRPNVLANYLFELANSFHGFYEACPVLRSEEPARSSRLALCDLTGRVLERGLGLLGIEVPERM